MGLRQIIYILIVFTALGCVGFYVVNENSNPSYGEQTILELEYLRTSITSTDFTGLIANITIETVEEPDPYPNDDYVEERHIIKADVVKTYFGEPISEVTFVNVTEKGEGFSFGEKENIVISLCKINGEYIYAGMGTVFPSNDIILNEVQKIITSNPERTRRYCDY